ncbi:MAG: PIG-L family deacetylase [Zoogloeaceae bacterium]|nr:PIG-L family deacetylase [Zoogloeaceae bacterium]
MGARKQRLLRRYRRNKRIALLLALPVLAGLAVWVSVWLLPPGLLLAWVIHEAWFSDHLFYPPGEDYVYRFPEDTQTVRLAVREGRLVLAESLELGDPERDTLIVRLVIDSGWLGRCFDPHVVLGDDRQTFERGARGARYLNLTGQGAQLLGGTLRIAGRYCRIGDQGQLFVFPHVDLRQANTLILAPHADDAELAAFGLYSRIDKAAIVTLTQGEIEAEEYRRLGLDGRQAAQLKGRLRAWDSMTIPQWGGVPQRHCVQLGYYCLQLAEMQRRPEAAFASRESGECDVRTVRRWNALALPADGDGLPTWRNLVADLAACLEHFRPEAVILPHPELDPHADHVATMQAFTDALALGAWRPARLLLYANHLHDNDRWPMGDAETGVALPPATAELPADALFSHCLDARQRLDKAMALRMQHDLQAPLPIKKRLRRAIQHGLLGRRWPAAGENEFLRKAMRRHELFWLRHPD